MCLYDVKIVILGEIGKGIDEKSLNRRDGL